MPINRTQRKRIRDAYFHVFSTLEGRLVLKDMIRTAGLCRVTGVVSADELQHAEGGRDFVRRVLQMLSYSEEEFLQLTEEPVIHE